MLRYFRSSRAPQTGRSGSRLSGRLEGVFPTNRRLTSASHSVICNAMGVLSQILPCLPQTGRKFSPFQMLLLTLMHLRLNLPIQHMAHLFCIDRSTVSTTFTNTIDVMFTHLAAG
ncbi:hypothetical protein ILYODFUR_023069 [Ilyodon furcidens]|uniref:Transposase Helix-turn-helix domain-containing protein n=1 Tax=Ilyodon furcidens TaxID=33524 RepID=A0ABV0V8A6_9TELE